MNNSGSLRYFVRWHSFGFIAKLGLSLCVVGLYARPVIKYSTKWKCFLKLFRPPGKLNVLALVHFRFVFFHWGMQIWHYNGSHFSINMLCEDVYGIAQVKHATRCGHANRYMCASCGLVLRKWIIFAAIFIKKNIASTLMRLYNSHNDHNNICCLFISKGDFSQDK